MTICRVSEIRHAWRPLACGITKTQYFSMVVPRTAPTHEKRTGKMPGSCLPINYLICLTPLTGKTLRWRDAEAGRGLGSLNMLKMLSVLSQTCLSNSSICSVIAFYLGSRWVFQTDKERGDPPTLFTWSTWWREARCDLGCVPRPMLTHIPPCCARLAHLESGREWKGENKWTFSEGLTHAVSLVISLSAGLANSLQHLIKEELFFL